MSRLLQIQQQQQSAQALWQAEQEIEAMTEMFNKYALSSFLLASSLSFCLPLFLPSLLSSHFSSY